MSSLILIFTDKVINLLINDDKDFVTPKTSEKDIVSEEEMRPRNL